LDIKRFKEVSCATRKKEGTVLLLLAAVGVSAGLDSYA
jgi:hypothetical protein